MSPYSLYDKYLRAKKALLFPLLYTLLSSPLETLREEWNATAYPLLRTPYRYGFSVPDRVKETVFGQYSPVVPPPTVRDPRLPPLRLLPTPTTPPPYMLDPQESDSLVIHTFNIVEELTTPNSNLVGRMLIECSKGNLDQVKDLASKPEVAGKKILQSMLVTSLAFKHFEVAKFCIKQGARVDRDVDFATWSTMNEKWFELLFPLDVFSVSQHPEHLDFLLYDCFDRWPTSFSAPRGTAPSEVKSLAEFLFEHDARFAKNSFEIAMFRWPELEQFILSYVTEEDFKGGIAFEAIKQLIMLRPGDEGRIEKLLDLSASAKIPEALMWIAVGKQLGIVKLLHSRGVAVTECRYLIETAHRGKVGIVSYILDRGLDVNCRDTKGYFGVYSYQDPVFPNYGYALHYAVYMGHPEVVRVLLKRGADPNLRGVVDATAFEVGVGKANPDGVKEVKRLLGLIKDQPLENIPSIIERDQREYNVDRTEL